MQEHNNTYLIKKAKRKTTLAYKIKRQPGGQHARQAVFLREYNETVVKAVLSFCDCIVPHHF